MFLDSKNLNKILQDPKVIDFSQNIRKFRVMYPGILIKLKCVIFRRNSIFNPGIMIKFLSFHKKSNSHKLKSFIWGGATRTKYFDS
jgi:hypothetical protein